MKHVVIPGVNIFIVDGTKILLGRRINTGWMDGCLCPPGGHIEKDETPTAAAIREIQEELGQTIASEDLEFLCIAARNQGVSEYVAYEFVIRDKPYAYKNAEPDKCSELVWVDVHNLPKDVIEDFRIVIAKALLGGQPYLEIGY